MRRVMDGKEKAFMTVLEDSYLKEEGQVCSEEFAKRLIELALNNFENEILFDYLEDEDISLLLSERGIEND